MSYARNLTERRARAGIWGAGYIGYTSMLHLAEQGIDCTAFDPDPAKVALVNCGRHPVPGLSDWLTIDAGQLVESGLAKASSDAADLLDPDVLLHVVAVPTERGGRPWWEPLNDVMSKLADFIAGARGRFDRPPLVIIESTLTPGTVDDRILPILAKRRIGPDDMLLGIAPRRDWFVSPDKTLKTLDRIYCGISETAADETHGVLALICERLHRASNYRVGEMVKCTENAFRHLEITLANQLSIAYPHIDITEVLDLASTKWNMGSYKPSFGTGGYCVPLAGQYVLEGARDPDALSLLTLAYESDIRMRWHVARSVLERGRKRIAILGLSYRGDLKVAVMSPSILIARHFLEAGVEVSVHDPYYSETEIRELTGAGTLTIPDDLHDYDAIVVSTNHKDYSSDEVRRAVMALAGDLLIIDNFGIWSGWPWPAGSNYFRAGAPGWSGAGSPESDIRRRLPVKSRRDPIKVGMGG